ncbi:sugar (Glycoside-Pentoside-Hexuronide) transporter [Gloeothece citriformis PCC 7424]|uniref:Sugar (Glycoside-Pentoside-Hexuronide) transporter n=1 Tax=Gloeothece citriformis (strain PCC 7424) TaxID=65393 RepID=B7KAJ7_GLOC7|nr:MFS transporter [Gloeothece citriformis]ACK68669.1 sugar (Glycoside-Pentoside-Hexuronide) transporter [Gloeothece citriformis PCC 7424]
MNEIKPKSEKLNLSTKLAFGAGDLGAAITANILAFYLLFFFTNVAGLPAGMAGSVLMIGKIADAINDPIVGVMSDRTRSPWGRRLPWILLGAIPFGILYFLQWIVPDFSDNPGVNNWSLFAYYVLIGILFNIAYTAVNLPYTALTPELTQDYDERTNLNSFRFTFSIGGSILSLILAGLIFAAFPDPQQNQTKYLILGLQCSILSVIPAFWCALRVQERGAKPILNPSQKKWVGYGLIGVGGISLFYGIGRLIALGSIGYLSVFSFLLSLLILLFGGTLIFGTPEPHLINEEAVNKRSESAATPSLSYGEQLKIAFSNRPFLYVIGIYLCSWLAVQLTASILIYFVVSWMGLSAAMFSLVALAVQGTALVMLFFWQKVSESMGKKAVYFIGMSIWIVAQIGLFFLQPGQEILMYILAILAGFGVSVAYLIPWSMIPDVIELDELNTGQRREGVFYAFMVLLQKFGLALGLFLVGIALESAGFVEALPEQPVPVQPESALLAIRIAISPLPAFFLIAGLVLAYFYPITKEVHANIRLQLEERNRH